MRSMSADDQGLQRRAVLAEREAWGSPASFSALLANLLALPTLIASDRTQPCLARRPGR
jgi:hypothetical protein